MPSLAVPAPLPTKDAIRSALLAHSVPPHLNPDSSRTEKALLAIIKSVLEHVEHPDTPQLHRAELTRLLRLSRAVLADFDTAVKDPCMVTWDVSSARIDDLRATVDDNGPAAHRARALLADCVRTGAHPDVEKDPPSAVSMYRDGAVSGDFVSMHRWAECLIRGEGCTPNHLKALTLLHLSAQKCLALGLSSKVQRSRIAFLLLTSPHIAPIPHLETALALRFWQEEALLGDTYAMAELTKLASQSDRHDLAVHWATEGAISGQDECRMLLASFYDRGVGVAASSSVAKRLRALQSGYKPSEVDSILPASHPPHEQRHKLEEITNVSRLVSTEAEAHFKLVDDQWALRVIEDGDAKARRAVRLSRDKEVRKANAACGHVESLLKMWELGEGDESVESKLEFAAIEGKAQAFSWMASRLEESDPDSANEWIRYGVKANDPACLVRHAQTLDPTEPEHVELLTRAGRHPVALRLLGEAARTNGDATASSKFLLAAVKEGDVPAARILVPEPFAPAATLRQRVKEGDLNALHVLASTVTGDVAIAAHRRCVDAGDRTQRFWGFLGIARVLEDELDERGAIEARLDAIRSWERGEVGGIAARWDSYTFLRAVGGKDEPVANDEAKVDVQKKKGWGWGRR